MSEGAVLVRALKGAQWRRKHARRRCARALAELHEEVGVEGVGVGVWGDEVVAKRAEADGDLRTLE